MILELSQNVRSAWQVPTFELPMWHGQHNLYCVVIPVINEGHRIRQLLERMSLLNIAAIADIIIVDGGSTDASLELPMLHEHGVMGLLVKTGPGKLSSQLRCVYAFAMDKGYAGVISIDGNDKDDPEAIPRFIEALNEGYDFVQASRFVAGGTGENTPKLRDFAIRFIHAPMLRIFSGFAWTDTTQGFRAYSRIMILDSRVSIFRDVFVTYELLAYLSYRVHKLGYRCLEIPTIRRYPIGKIPTKISSIKGNLSVFWILIKTCLGVFNPSDSSEKVFK
jgi:glycosyltransferase involved in cell wall biosynthesis